MEFRALAIAATVVAALLCRSAIAEGDFHFTADVSGWIDRSAAQFDLGKGSPVTVTGVEWDVTLTATDGAWLSDGWFGLGTPDNLPQLFLIPGIEDNFGGTQTYSGSVKFADLGVADVQLPNGVLLLQFLTSGWNIVVKDQSFVTFQYNVVPTPGAGLLLVTAAFLSFRRRRPLPAASTR